MSLSYESQVHSKRGNSEIHSSGRSGSAISTNKRQELDNANKPGRKPLQSEPKNKRTAQNRAAQRAFRERKERRMKELEDKVADLEGEKAELHNESEFLRDQVATLMNELKRFRGDADITDLLPKKVPSLSTNSVTSQSSRSASDVGAASTPASSNGSPGIKREPGSFEYTFNHSRVPDQQKVYRANTAISSESSSSLLDKSETNTPKMFNNPGLMNNDSISSNSSSVSTSNSPKDLQDLGITRDDELLPLFGSHSLRRSSILNNEITANEPFDEKANEFCMKLSEACGNKSCPVPKSMAGKSAAGVSTAMTGHTFGSETSKVAPSPFNFNEESPLSPFSALINEQIVSHTLQEQKQDVSDPYSFLVETPFDPSIAFDINEYGDFLNKDQTSESNLDQLVSEESMYDPLGMFNASKETPAEVSPLNPTMSIPTNMDMAGNSGFDLPGNLQAQKPDDNAEDDDPNAVVPSSDSNLLKCSAIWDRITQHPRYTQIDIEGLCNELKEKAKCSERGAVVEAKDVSKLLDGSYAATEKSQAAYSEKWRS